ncbi:MAG: FAD-dependent oxidoreductase, partial [Candidatus Brocadiia bacterium]
RVGEYVARGHRVTVVSPADYHYYSGMGPGLLSGIYGPQQARFHVRRLAERGGAEFVRDRAVRIEPDDRRIFLESGRQVRYDVASFNTGSEVPVGGLADADEPGVFPVKPIVNLLRAREAILGACAREGAARVVVVGGGAAGIELSGNAHRLISETGASAELTLIGGSALLPRQPERARRLARTSLRRRGVEILEGVRARRLSGGEAVTDDGRTIPYDVALVAVGVRPSDLFRRSGLPTGESGGLLVDEHLRSVTGEPIFGGGDCISLAGANLQRVGVHAVRQNPVLYHNLMVALEGGQPEAFQPSGAYLLILNMGDGRGVASKWGLTLDGPLAFRLKDYIDRRFMARYQLCGEGEESPGRRQ